MGSGKCGTLKCVHNLSQKYVMARFELYSIYNIRYFSKRFWANELAAFLISWLVRTMCKAMSPQNMIMRGMSLWRMPYKSKTPLHENMVIQTSVMTTCFLYPLQLMCGDSKITKNIIRACFIIYTRTKAICGLRLQHTNICNIFL